MIDDGEVRLEWMETNFFFSGFGGCCDECMNITVEDEEEEDEGDEEKEKKVRW